MNLVTGATGIVGSHVVLALLQNNEPVLATRQKNSDISKTEKLFSYYTPDYKQLFQKIKWLELNLSDLFAIEDALAEVTAVYHCAGSVSFLKADKKKMVEVNETGTRNLVNACLGKNIKAFCYVSSIATINNLDHKSALNEEVFWKTSGKESDYAFSKYNGEREVWRGIEEGLNAVIVNPGLILSPGFWDQSSSKLFETCYRGNSFYTEGTSAYVAASDVANCMIALVNKKCFGQRYILVENNYSFLQIFSLIQSAFHKKAPGIKLSRAVLKFVSKLESILCLFSGKSPKLGAGIVNAAFNQQLFDNTKVKSELACEFRSTAQVIAEICRHYSLEKDRT